ncbi:DMT family transporter [Pseudomonas abietaniphila]|uniref:DMT family transporter n=1 Tax=Pseudomonas abietaniphila TaxID=89065 RepID=UPI0032162464
MPSVYFFLALAAGAMLPLQAVVNARLARAVDGPLWAAAISALVVSVVLAGIALASGKPWPRPALMVGLPWWAWVGGLCGAVVLSATAAVAPRLGAGCMIALIMVGQVVTALALDRLGWFDMAVQYLTIKKLVAAVILIFGAVLMGM